MSRNTAFRLERILEYRRRLTESAQQALALRSRERAEAEAALGQLQAEQAELAGYLRQSLQAGEVDLTTLVAAEAYAGSLRASARRQTQATREARARESQALDDLLDRRIDQRVLEKLRERSLREQEEREMAAEMRLLDEVATTRHGNQARIGADHGR